MLTPNRAFVNLSKKSGPVDLKTLLTPLCCFYSNKNGALFYPVLRIYRRIFDDHTHDFVKCTCNLPAWQH